jgi:hypothetical protein
MTWEVKRTATFIESLSAIRKNKEALFELDKKMKRLQEDPLHLGGWLSGGTTRQEIDKNFKKISSNIYAE